VLSAQPVRGGVGWIDAEDVGGFAPDDKLGTAVGEPVEVSKTTWPAKSVDLAALDDVVKLHIAVGAGKQQQVGVADALRQRLEPRLQPGGTSD
jgi:hypothetical protein